MGYSAGTVDPIVIRQCNCLNSFPKYKRPSSPVRVRLAAGQHDLEQGVEVGEHVVRALGAEGEQGGGGGGREARVAEGAAHEVEGGVEEGRVAAEAGGEVGEEAQARAADGGVRVRRQAEQGVDHLAGGGRLALRAEALGEGAEDEEGGLERVPRGARRLQAAVDLAPYK